MMNEKKKVESSSEPSVRMVSREELMQSCYTVEESERMITKMIHRHFKAL